MYCIKCGKENPESAIYCKNCGEKTSHSPEKVHAERATTPRLGVENTSRNIKIRCPNPECNILFKVREGQEKCYYCGTSLFNKTRKGKKGKIYCSLCFKEITQNEYHIVPSEKEGEEETYFHLECADLVSQALVEETQEINYPAAVGYGILFGLGAALLWYLFTVITNYKLGLVAIGVGWLVAQGVSIGAGRKRGKEVQVISVIIVAFSLFFAEYLILNHFFQQILAEEGVTGMSLSITRYPSLLIEVLGEEDNIIDLLFWGIALYEGYVIPGRRRLKGYKI